MFCAYISRECTGAVQRTKQNQCAMRLGETACRIIEVIRRGKGGEKEEKEEKEKSRRGVEKGNGEGMIERRNDDCDMNENKKENENGAFEIVRSTLDGNYIY